MGFMKAMDEANYNFDAQKEGWIYNWTERFIIENRDIITPEIMEVTLTNLPPIQVYNNPTEQMKNEKNHAEQILNQNIIMITNNKDTMEVSRFLQAEWNRRCDQARVANHLSQNDANAILNVKSSWDRKQYDKSYKPIK